MSDAGCAFLFPFEEQANAFVFDLLEAEALVKAKGGVEFLNVDGQRVAWSPPAGVSALEAICVIEAGAAYMAIPPTPPANSGCAGISDSSNDTVCKPPNSPRRFLKKSNWVDR